MRWGVELQFVENETSVVRAVPELDSDTVKRVVITWADGHRPTLERMMKELKERYTGKPYSDWR